MTDTKIYAVLKGMKYRITPATMKDIADLCPLKVKLERDEENVHDENAIGVFCIERPWKNTHFGYVNREIALELAPRLDAGKVEVTEAWLDEIDEQGEGPLRIKFRKV